MPIVHTETVAGITGRIETETDADGNAWILVPIVTEGGTRKLYRFSSSDAGWLRAWLVKLGDE